MKRVFGEKDKGESFEIRTYNENAGLNIRLVYSFEER
jgi:hypothetical protein